MRFSTIVALGLGVTSSLPAVAQDSAPTVVAGGDATIVYVFPTSPQTFVPVAGLPSFLVMPGAELPPVATQVVYSIPRPASIANVGVSAAGPLEARLDCSDFVGVVTIAGPDRFHLDKDGDGVGCEPEDR